MLRKANSKRVVAALGQEEAAGKNALYLLGNMHREMVLIEEAGNLSFSPFQYDRKSNERKPLNTEVWDDPEGYEGRKIPPVADWLERCAACHTTGYDPASLTYAEPSIACESCHGPGSKHAKSESKDDIVNPASLPGELGSHVCGQCHGRGVDPSGKHPFQVGFKPGKDLTKHLVLAKPSGKNDSLFWGNGAARKHRSQFNEFAQSKHSTHQAMRCFDCHEIHRYRRTSSAERPRFTGRTERFLLKRRAHNACLKCHEERESSYATVDGKLVDTHTHHPVVIQKGKKQQKLYCWECHMPLIDKGDTYLTRAHTFKVPKPSDTIEFGVPNACTQCHEDKSPQWAQLEIESWRK